MSQQRQEPKQLITPEVIAKFDSVLARGLCKGLGERDGQMCIEAAICFALDLPHGDEPNCVSEAVRKYKIKLNDSIWSSNQARARGLRDLGIAQIGSLGVVDDVKFTKKLSELTIRVLIPQLFRLDKFKNNVKMQEAANRCELEGSIGAAAAAADAAAADAAAADAAAYAAASASAASAASAAYAAYAAYAADYAAYAAAYAAYAAAYASAAAAASASAAYVAELPQDYFLLLSAKLALQVLRELGSPSCEWVPIAE